jgi:hypothetical protein
MVCPAPAWITIWTKRQTFPIFFQGHEPWSRHASAYTGAVNRE